MGGGGGASGAEMKMSIHNEWIAMKVSRCVDIYIYISTHLLTFINNVYIYRRVNHTRTHLNEQVNC